MTDFEEYAEEHKGETVLVSTMTGKHQGILAGSKKDPEGKTVTLILQQYLHRTEVETEEILNIRVI